MRVRLTQIDGKLPNLALMKLAHYHRARGDDVHFSKSVDRDMLEPAGASPTSGDGIATKVKRLTGFYPAAEFCEVMMGFPPGWTE